MIRIAEDALKLYMTQIPADYRRRPLYRQPDIVWGERVLPNFRYTLDCLNQAFVKLTHGDVSALDWASNVNSDFVGFSRDYSSSWMDELGAISVAPHASEEFWLRLSGANGRASNISATLNAAWARGELSFNYATARGPLNLPAEWPLYKLNMGCRVFTGESVPRTGIYLPDAEDSVPAFMIEGRLAHAAAIGYDKRSLQPVKEDASGWTLVERVADTGGGIPFAADQPATSAVHLRCDAGQPCPRTGYWFTPAKLDSRRHFQAGEIMPAFQSQWGMTIWQWDVNQEI